MRRIAIVACLALALAGCESESDGRTVGAVVGGVAGALLGSQIGSGAGRVAATIGLGVLGGYIGGEIGADLSREDRVIAARTTEDALENNQPGQMSAWSNPDTGAAGTVTPGPRYVRSAPAAPSGASSTDGRSCRDIKVTVSPAGKPQKNGTRTACRKANGEWEVLDA